MRKFYLDNVRWIIVLSVLPFHVFFVSNGLGIEGAMPGMENIRLMDLVALYLYNPWFMPLIFLISGIAARHALQKRNNKQFFKDRVDRLLVPGTIGLFVYQWISSLITVYATNPAVLQDNTGLIGSFVKYVLFALIGTGPLWVAQVLFICCCVLLLIRKIDKNDRIHKFCGNINLLVLISLFLIIWVASNILDFPIEAYALFRYRIGTNLVVFLIGYYVLSHEKVQELVEKKSVLLSVLAIISTIVLAVYVIINSEHISNAHFTQNILTIWYLWVVILAVMGFAKKHLNKETAFTKYMSKISYGLLIVHYPILIFLCVVIPPLGLPVILNHLLIIVLEIALSFVVYQLLSRIPIIRYCIFGYRKNIKSYKTHSSSDVPPTKD